MITLIRNSIFSKILWGILAFYLLNISVDSADPAPEHVPEDLSINDQESIIELVLEHFLGYEDAVKEYDDNDHGDISKKQFGKVVLHTHSESTSAVSGTSFCKNRKSLTIYLMHVKGRFPEIDSPPPKV